MLILSKLPGILLLVLATASSAWAADSRALAAVSAVAEAERNFARAAVAHGIRDSFLQNFADDGVVFAPAPTKAKAFYKKYEDKGRRLIWQPVFATASNSGDLGLTTGPWELKKSATDETSLAFGQFVSVWKKQADNSWRVIVDVGIDHPQPPGPPGDLQLSPPNEPLGKADAKMQRDAFEKAEQTFHDALKVDAGAALLEAGGDDMRVFRDNAFPTVGKPAAKLLAGSDHAKTTRINSGGGISGSGDLAYRYGAYSSEQPGGNERGYYLILWSVDLKGTWKILIDLQKKAEAK
jgi:ketosteroid isomerase-like protein